MPPKKLREPEARILALRIAAAQPSHEASTAFIKTEVPKYVELTPADLEPSPSREHEQHWQQIVGNVVSHQDSSTSIFTNGYAERTEDGIRITEKGLIHLKTLGH
jgi:hypothetical protein